ncbi:MAG: response regulator [Bacteriovoracaceae bacterium]|nr:response regulator [Bacteriovoracaceae bacterium]
MSHILIVEDDDDIRTILKETLEMMGHKVTAAADGNQGYTASEAGGFNLIITDYLMPKLDGLAMIEKIKEKSQSKQTPIIIFSTFKETINLLMAKYPNVSFVSKPGPLEKLAEKIEEQLAL